MEALALSWRLVDLDGGWFTIAESVGWHTAGRATVGDTKAEAGERELPLTPQALDALHVQKDRQDFDRKRLGDDYNPRDVVLATSIGTPFTERSCLRT